MVEVQRYLIGAAFALAIGGGLWLHGFQSGGQANEAQHVAATAKLQQALFDAADRQSELAAEVESYRADQAGRAIIAEDAARADPASDTRRPSADSLRRLRERWGADSGG